MTKANKNIHQKLELLEKNRWKAKEIAEYLGVTTRTGLRYYNEIIKRDSDNLNSLGVSVSTAIRYLTGLTLSEEIERLKKLLE